MNTIPLLKPVAIIKLHLMFEMDKIIKKKTKQFKIKGRLLTSEGTSLSGTGSV
jgi:hypothetical protein